MRKASRGLGSHGRFLLVFSLACCAYPFAAQASPAPQPIAASSAAVTLDGRTVLVVRTRLLSLSTEERALRASDRILKIAGNPRAGLDGIQVVDGEMASDIAAGDFILMSVTDADGTAEQTACRTPRCLTRNHSRFPAVFAVS